MRQQVLKYMYSQKNNYDCFEFYYRLMFGKSLWITVSFDFTVTWATACTLVTKLLDSYHVFE